MAAWVLTISYSSSVRVPGVNRIDAGRHTLPRSWMPPASRSRSTERRVQPARAAILAAGGFDPGLRSAQDYEMWLAILADRDLHPSPLVDPREGPRLALAMPLIDGYEVSRLLDVRL